MRGMRGDEKWNERNEGGSEMERKERRGKLNNEKEMEK